MRIVNEFAPGAIAGGATIEAGRAPAHEPSLRQSGLIRRIGAIVRLLMRRRRAALVRGELDQLDAATRRDVGLAERGWSAMDAAARVAAVRRQTEYNYLSSASSRFVVRNVDTGL